MPDPATVEETMKRVRHLEIRAKRLVQEAFAGEYHSSFKGRGLDFSEFREYQHGDEVRFLDWNVTARMNVRFRRPIPLDEPVSAFSRKTHTHGGFLEARGWVELPDGSVAADAEGKFAFLEPETLARMTDGYPVLAREWMAS